MDLQPKENCTLVQMQQETRLKFCNLDEKENVKLSIPEKFENQLSIQNFQYWHISTILTCFICIDQVLYLWAEIQDLNIFN